MYENITQLLIKSTFIKKKYGRISNDQVNSR